MPKGQYKAPALEKGLDILEHLSKCDTPQSMSDITDSLGRSRSEIFRMVFVLEERGYLMRDAQSDDFRLSNKLFELGMSQPPITDLHDAARPRMSALAEDIRQSVQLVVASGDQIVVIGRVESLGDMGFSVRVGYRRPIVQSSSGIALFAFAEPDAQARMLDGVAASGAKTSDISAFKKEMDKAIRQGVVQHPSRFVEGVTDICAPIFDAISDRPAASLTVPFVRGQDAFVDIDEATVSVLNTAESISRTLQGRRSAAT